MANSPNNDPIYISRPFHWLAELTNQVLSRAGGSITSTTPALLGTAGDNGGVITSIGINVTGNTAANVAVLFTPNSDGNAVIRGEVALPAVVGISNTAIATGYPVKFALYDSEPFEAGTANFLKLAPSESIYVALLIAEATSKFVVHATGGLYDQI